MFNAVNNLGFTNFLNLLQKQPYFYLLKGINRIFDNFHNTALRQSRNQYIYK